MGEIERVGASAYLSQSGNNLGYRSFVMVDPATISGFVLLTKHERGQKQAEPIANGLLPKDHRVFRFRVLCGGIACGDGGNTDLLAFCWRSRIDVHGLVLADGEKRGNLVAAPYTLLQSWIVH